MTKSDDTRFELQIRSEDTEFMSEFVSLSERLGLTVATSGRSSSQRGIVHELVISGVASTLVYQVARLVRSAIEMRGVHVTVCRPDGVTVEFGGSRGSISKLSEVVEALGGTSDRVDRPNALDKQHDEDSR